MLPMTIPLAENPTDGTGRVTFSVKELLTEISKKIDIIDTKLDTKAEKFIVEALDRRVSVIETARSSERDFGLTVMNEFRVHQQDLGKAKERLVVLETSAKNQNNWNILWIPTILNALGIIFVGLFSYWK